jgi:hypothetical protein
MNAKYEAKNAEYLEMNAKYEAKEVEYKLNNEANKQVESTEMKAKYDTMILEYDQKQKLYMNIIQQLYKICTS